MQHHCRLLFEQGSNLKDLPHLTSNSIYLSFLKALFVKDSLIEWATVFFFNNLLIYKPA